MKTTHFNRKALAFLGAAAVLLATVFIASCKTEVSSSDPVPETFALTFKSGEHGSVDAKVGGKAIATGAKLEKGTTVEFTATPESGYKVDKWTVTGGELVAGTGAEGSTTAKVKITGNVTVSVSFKVMVVEISSVVIPKAGISYGGNKLPVKITGKNFKAPDVTVGDFSWSGAALSNFKIESDTLATAEVVCPNVAGNTTVTVMCKTASKSGVLSVTDYSAYTVGKIVLADKSSVEKASYTAIDPNNPPVGVICGHTYGVPNMIALHSSDSELQWAKYGSTGFNTKFEGIICTPSKSGIGAALTATFTGDTDGSDNWSYIKSKDAEGTADAVVAENYPAFNWVSQYNTKYADKLNNKKFDWYMPSLAELCGVYKNRTAIDASLAKIHGLENGSGYADEKLVNSYYWSSSQYSTYGSYAWVVDFSDGYVLNGVKSSNCRVCCLAGF